MITDKHQSIVEHVRALTEENAAEHGFCLDAIFESARKRQEISGHPIIRLKRGDGEAPRAAAAPEPE